MSEKKVLFGPSGLDESKQKLKILDVPHELAIDGLDCFEYSFTEGVRLSDEKAMEYGNKFLEYNIPLSVHAPYYINFANTDSLKIDASIDYIVQTIEKAKLMNADRIVFHPGSLMKQSREDALITTIKNLKLLIEVLKEKNLLDGIWLCPETMGKHGQIGTVDEVLKMCEIDEHFVPTIDFGHVNAFLQGELNSVERFDSIFNKLKTALGERVNYLHIHFSVIEFGAKGELRHLTFDNDKGFGPSAEQFVFSLKKSGIFARVVSESKGTQWKDSKTLKKLFEK